MSKLVPVDPFDCVVFGATGDLSLRKLMPSLYHRWNDGQIPEKSRIIGAARQSLSTAEFRTMIRTKYEEFFPGEKIDAAKWASFLERVSYCELDVADAKGNWKGLGELLDGANGKKRMFYFALPPSLYGDVAANIVAAGLKTADTRIVLEKPIGTDLDSARAINDAVGKTFDETEVFRIDHYLGKETVQNLLILRFANSLFEPVWNAGAIDHVQISVNESIGAGGRASYYDKSGALRDMVQNHLMQLLCLVAMEPPLDLGADTVRDEKIKVLKALRPFTAETAREYSVRGQYKAGVVDGKSAPAYAEELGKASETETFVALKAHIDNWRWAGVPFYLRTGKRLPERVTEILIQFRCVPHSIFEGMGAGLKPNKLLIGIQPEEDITLSLMAKVPGLDEDGVRLREVPLKIAMPDAFAEKQRRIAYERLLLDLIKGDQTLFVRRDEVEAQWHWIDAIRAEWEANGVTPKTYGAGTWGPSAAIALTERDGVSWHE